MSATSTFCVTSHSKIFFVHVRLGLIFSVCTLKCCGTSSTHPIDLIVIDENGGQQDQWFV